MKNRFLLSFILIATFNPSFGSDNISLVKIPKSLVVNNLFSEKYYLRNPNNAAPVLRATGDQIYCPQTTMKVVTDFSITDSDDVSTDALYVQISSGYNAQTDLLALTGSHPNVVAAWNPVNGKLELKSPTNIPVLYADFVLAVKNVVYSNSSALPTGNRAFSITIGQNNYLPSNGHYYQYVSNVGIGWNEAKTAAESMSYYGLQGYLATITAADEQQLIGEQSLGTGWIAGSDAETEGVWKWKSGPENGIIFFQNLVLQPNGNFVSDPTSVGTTPIFSYWNRSGGTFEPNNQGGNENYVHITAPGIGLRGSWNDASLYASPSGNYQSKGYIVEYGGMPGDPTISIAAFTKMTIPQILKTIPMERCGSGSVNLTAESNVGSVSWYDAEFGGTLQFTGNTFSTPILNASKTYWVEANYAGCTIKSLRTKIVATIFNVPVVTTLANQIFLCGGGDALLTVSTTTGDIHWFETATSTTVFAIGNSISRNFTNTVTYYAEAVNTPCADGKRMAVTVFVYKLPVVADQTLILCKGEKILLDAKYPNATYLWSNGATTQTTEVASGGNYTVSITTASPENCVSVNKILVTEKTVSPIKTVTVTENTVTIILENPNLQSEYSLDGITFQASNVFQNVSGGLQYAYVRDTDLCGVSAKFPFIVLDIPKFFTPNGDSYNDFWSIAGFSNFPQTTVHIYDRFGKLIVQLNKNKASWDGTYNNNPLPADDYWYVLQMENNTVVIKGHFTLKR